MKFILDAEQRLFGETVDKLLAEADTPAVIRAWAAGTTEPGRAVWQALAEAGVFALAVPESHDGAGLLPVELVTAFHEIGRHAAPGPYVETAAAAVLLDRLGDPDLAARWLPGIAEGSVVATLVSPPLVAYALDADAADVVFAVDGTGLRVLPGLGSAGAAAGDPPRTSLDPARRLFPVPRAAGPGATVAEAGVSGGTGEHVPADSAVLVEALATACDLGVLLSAAQLVGLGRRLLETTVAYATTRKQFGRAIGEFQAVKHHLANALVGLEYARPLVHGAALAVGSPAFARDVSAAKAAASDAAYEAAKIALQVHGAIGYTDEYDPSLWIRKVRALHSAWGSPAAHRARVLEAIRGGRPSV